MKRPAIEGGPRVRSRQLPFSPPDIGEEEVRAVSDVLRSGWITTGPLCTGFEQALTAYTGASHGVLLSSATAGLYLCLPPHDSIFRDMLLGKSLERIQSPSIGVSSALRLYRSQELLLRIVKSGVVFSFRHPISLR